MAGENDLKMVNNDLVFSPDGEPLYLTGADVVAQDVATRIRATGLAAELVADDGPPLGAAIAMKIEVEKDDRIQPGTVQVEQLAAGRFQVTAQTMEGEPITVTV